jgi:hypothetical protein
MVIVLCAFFSFMSKSPEFLRMEVKLIYKIIIPFAVYPTSLFTYLYVVTVYLFGISYLLFERSDRLVFSLSGLNDFKELIDLLDYCFIGTTSPLSRLFRFDIP